MENLPTSVNRLTFLVKNCSLDFVPFSARPVAGCRLEELELARHGSVEGGVVGNDEAIDQAFAV